MKSKFLWLGTMLLAVAFDPLFAEEKKDNAKLIEIPFAIGDEKFTMPLPEGYCVPTGDDVMASAKFADSDSGARTLVDLDLCGTFGIDYVLVKTPRNHSQIPFSKLRFFEIVARQMRQPETIERATDRASEDVSELLKEEVSLDTQEYGFDGYDDDCLYASGLIAVVTADDTVKVPAAGCTTVINRRVLAIHAFDSSHKPATVEELKNRARSVALSIRAE